MKDQHVEWLTPDELEDKLGIKKSTQAKMRMKRLLPFSKFGKFVFYDRKKIDEILKNHSIEVSNG